MPRAALNQTIESNRVALHPVDRSAPTIRMATRAIPATTITGHTRTVRATTSQLVSTTWGRSKRCPRREKSKGQT